VLHLDCPPGACPGSQLNWRKILGLPGPCATQEGGSQTTAAWQHVSPTLRRDWNPGLHDSHQAEKITPTLSGHALKADVTEDTGWRLFLFCFWLGFFYLMNGT